MRFDEAASWKKRNEGGKGGTEAEKAEEWLLEFMDGRRVLASEVEAAAKDEGFKRGILYKAKKNLEQDSVKDSNVWYWIPPNVRREAA